MLDNEQPELVEISAFKRLHPHEHREPIYTEDEIQEVETAPIKIDDKTWTALRRILVSARVSDRDFITRVSTWNTMLASYNITSVRRLSAFLGQCSAESGFAELAENMNYSAQRIVAIWPRRFKSVNDAKPYAHNPEKLGNKVYSRRLGNGDENSGDGYRFRGHGDIQTTGRDAFQRFGKLKQLTSEKAVEYATSAVGAIEVSCWEWRYNMVTRHGERCNDFADAWRLDRLTLLINGGYTDLEKRIRLCNAAFKIVAKAQNLPSSQWPPETLPRRSGRVKKS